MKKHAFMTSLIGFFALAATTIFLQAAADSEKETQTRAFAPTSLSTVSDETFDTEVSKHQKPVFLFACSSAMVPCHRMAPTVNLLAKKYGGEMKFVVMDPLASTNLTERYGLRAYPSCILLLPSSKFQYAHNIVVGPAQKEFLEQSIQRTIEAFKASAKSPRGLEGNNGYDDIVIFRQQQ